MPQLKIVTALIPLVVTALCGASSARVPSVTLSANTSVVGDGASVVRVSWTGIDLENLREHKTVWAEVAPSHPTEHTEPTMSVVTALVTSVHRKSSNCREAPITSVSTSIQPKAGSCQCG